MSGLWQNKSVKFRQHPVKSATSALVTYFNGLRPTSDAPLQAGDLFTIWLANGTILTYADLDLPVVWNGYIYLAYSVLVSGLRHKGSLGVNVDQQKIVISARSTDTIGGIPFLQALQQGPLMARSSSARRRFSRPGRQRAAHLVPIGAVIMFKGRVATIDDIGRTTATATVAADTVFLDIDMPRRLCRRIAPMCFTIPDVALLKGLIRRAGQSAPGRRIQGFPGHRLRRLTPRGS